jgi:cytochrome c-type biogenesis protein CcmH
MPVDAPARVRYRRVAAAAALLVIPLGASAIYLALGSPGIPGQPLAPRLEAAQANRDVASLIARVETHLERNPDDGRGWEVIAPIYLRLGRFDDAVRANRNALRTLGETVERQADLGEALVAAANGVVTAEAKGAFERAASLDGNEVRGHFYLGLAAEQDGDREQAARRWRALLDRAPQGAAWVDSVREALARVEEHSNANLPGPTADDISSAAKLDPAERDRMVRNMVDGLAQRLHADGSDAEGWLRLMRAYMVLGETEKARTAITDARRALANEPEKLRRINEGAKSIGLDG